MRNTYISDLYNVAIQCPLSGGTAVYRARTLYKFINPFQHYNDELTCLQGGYNYKQRPNGDVSKNIFPNPTTGEFTIIYQACSNSKLQILDQIGRVLKVYELSTKQNTFNGNISSLENGIYHCMITDERGSLIENMQIILQK